MNLRLSQTVSVISIYFNSQLTTQRATLCRTSNVAICWEKNVAF